MTQQERVQAERQRLETSKVDSQSLWVSRAILTLAEQVAIFNDMNAKQFECAIPSRAIQELRELRKAPAVPEEKNPPF